MYKALSLQEGGGIRWERLRSPMIANPCLMVGIGGTGIDALRQVKQEVYRTLIPDNPGDPVPRYSRIAFLGIDTDMDALFAGSSDTADLQPDEMISLNVPSLGTRLAEEKNQEDPCLQWLSAGITVDGVKDAGGVRQAGRFCLVKNAANVYEKIGAAVTQVMRAAGVPKVQVHLFAGLAGGTGSGCFLDVCYLIRQYFHERSIDGTICGYFFLPDTVLGMPGIQGDTDIEERCQRNGYAALRELEYCMHLPESGNRFLQSYNESLSVDSGKAPVDLCVLAPGTDKDGQIQPQNRDRCLCAAAEHVITYLADALATPAEKAADNTGITLEGLISNLRTGLAGLQPAARQYTILNAFRAALPTANVGTYLAARTYLDLARGIHWHATEETIQELVSTAGVTVDALIRDLSQDVLREIPFAPDIPLPSAVNEGEEDWNRTIPEIHEGVSRGTALVRAKIRENENAMQRNLDSVDVTRNAAMPNPPILVRIFNGLAEMAMDPRRGPTMAADALEANNPFGLRSMLRGMYNAVQAKENAFKNNIGACIQGVREAARGYNKGLLGKQKKFEAYQQTWNTYLENSTNLELCSAAKRLIPALDSRLENLLRSYFAPLQKMMEELRQTYEEDLRWLQDPKFRKYRIEDSTQADIFAIKDVQPMLEQVLQNLDAQQEYRNLLQYLLQNYTEWYTGDANRTAQCLNRYFTQRFREELSVSMDQRLMQVFHVSNREQLPHDIQNHLLGQIFQSAEPSLWADPAIDLQDATVSRNVLSVPSSSMAALSGARSFIGTQPNGTVRASTMEDRMVFVRYVSGTPLQAYQSLALWKTAYDRAPSGSGLHLYEKDTDWRQTLPILLPGDDTPPVPEETADALQDPEWTGAIPVADEAEPAPDEVPELVEEPEAVPAEEPVGEAGEVPQKICPACGTANGSDLRYCEECGALLDGQPVPEAEPEPAAEEAPPVLEIEAEPAPAIQKVCPLCYEENDADNTYCVNCGAPLDLDVQREPEPVPETWTCPNGHVSPWKHKFCGKCRAPRPWRCEVCGALTDKQQDFCPVCGAPWSDRP